MRAQQRNPRGHGVLTHTQQHKNTVVRINTLQVNKDLTDYDFSTLIACRLRDYNSRADPGSSGTNRTPIRSSRRRPCSLLVNLTSRCVPECGPSGSTIMPPGASSSTSGGGTSSA